MSKVIPITPKGAHPFSEDTLALKFAAAHVGDLRYVDNWKRWLHWNGKVWEFDATRYAYDQARIVCQRAADICEDAPLRKQLGSAATIRAVEWLAMSDRRLATTDRIWDLDPWLLNTPSGVVDLRTGETSDHDPRSLLTKITAVGPEPGCPAVWLSFLERVTDGDRDLQMFLQRIAGYALTGDTSSHAMFFLFGTGANGKSVFLDTLARILGDYHRTTPIETLVASGFDRHPTEIAGLRGARLVTATETEEGRRWAESRIKTLTGGDRISARFMRQDFFEFTPQFKLMIAGNHKPTLRTVDEAICRRFNLIPFDVTIPEQERDDRLREKLADELPMILSWMIEGCVDWWRIGLDQPEKVRLATNAYLEAEDAVATWIAQCCERDRAAYETSTDLFQSWKAWADANSEHFGSMKMLSQSLDSKGFQMRRTSSSRGFIGLKIRPDREEA